MSDICLYLLAGLSHDVTVPVLIPGHAFLDTTQVAVHTAVHTFRNCASRNSASHDVIVCLSVSLFCLSKYLLVHLSCDQLPRDTTTRSMSQVLHLRVFLPSCIL